MNYLNDEMENNDTTLCDDKDRIADLGINVYSYENVLNLGILKLDVDGTANI